MVLLSVGGRQPDIDPASWVAPSATVAGDVTLGAGSSLWYSVVARADAESVRVGVSTNIQDGCVLHADPGFPLVVGDRVSVGHRAVLHGCTVEDDVLVGMGAVVLNGARIGAGSLVGAGALVTQGTVVPPGSLVLGAPASVVRPTTEAERAGIRKNALHYERLAEEHRGAVVLPAPHASR